MEPEREWAWPERRLLERLKLQVSDFCLCHEVCSCRLFMLVSGVENSKSFRFVIIFRLSDAENY